MGKFRFELWGFTFTITLFCFFKKTFTKPNVWFRRDTNQAYPATEFGGKEWEGVVPIAIVTCIAYCGTTFALLARAVRKAPHLAAKWKEMVVGAGILGVFFIWTKRFPPKFSAPTVIYFHFK